VRHGNEFDPIIDHRRQGVRVGFAGFAAGDDVDHRAGRLRRLKIGDVVGGVFGLGRQNAVARFQPLGEPVERHLPGDGGVFDKGDFVGVGADQPRDGVVDPLAGVMAGGVGFVAADLGLQADVIALRVDHRLRHQARPGAVQVDQAVAAARRSGAFGGGVEV
jgi:hypothetical protein